MIIIESKVLKAANLFVAKGDIRYYLNGIHLNNRGAVEASDGHTGFISEQEALKEVKESLIIRMHGTIPAKSGMAYIEVIDKKKGIITFEGNEFILAFSIIDGKFPDMERVTPKPSEEEAVKEIGINSDYVVRIQKAAKIIDKNYKGMALKFHGPNKTIKVLVRSFDCECMILTMPMRM